MLGSIFKEKVTDTCKCLQGGIREGEEEGDMGRGQGGNGTCEK